MRKLLTFSDGEVFEITPISYEEFMVLGCWYNGGSDMAYKEFMYHNKFVEADQFEEEALDEAKFSLVAGEPIIEFKTEECNWVDYRLTEPSKRLGGSVKSSKLRIKYG